VKRTLLALSASALLVAACWGAPQSAEEVQQADGGTWYYLEGPNDEHCLVFRQPDGHSASGGMHCDSVNWPD
jgi:hypothetical protein